MAGARDATNYYLKKLRREERMTKTELAFTALGVIQGHFGNADERRNRLGKDYERVQTVVNCIVLNASEDEE